METVTLCANCGAVTNGAWWCSSSCQMEEDGPDWGEQDEREEREDEDDE